MVESDEEESEAAILFSQAKGDLCKNKPGIAKTIHFREKSVREKTNYYYLFGK